MISTSLSQKEYVVILSEAQNLGICLPVQAHIPIQAPAQEHQL
ncbi:hypothetical protein AciX9_3380 [Granulicella tundricola MP5ACTX9]|uniref:Uncharacterized protein n=1 Tax=Granulicella tundricola (strain ATCC BAA-1859 / DSM 23138 / MP5ACTX9) TaxID=1198114 RepID=E8X2U1_GRATM|nr:hypothetical protein AciX9_3380 [Granulicella tundricola MP5ACTX9]